MAKSQRWWCLPPLELLDLGQKLEYAGWKSSEHADCTGRGESANHSRCPS